MEDSQTFATKIHPPLLPQWLIQLCLIVPHKTLPKLSVLIPPLKSQLPIRLTGSTNFVTWKAKFLTLMCVYNLLTILMDPLNIHLKPLLMVIDKSRVLYFEYWFC